MTNTCSISWGCASEAVADVHMSFLRTEAFPSKTWRYFPNSGQLTFFERSVFMFSFKQMVLLSKIEDG